MYLTVLIYLFLAAATLQVSANKSVVVLMSDPRVLGTGPEGAYDSLSDVIRILDFANLTIVQVKAGDGSVSKALSKYPKQFYLHPGGGQDVPGVLKLYSKADKSAIVNFVKSGGKYLGICMGSYVAADGGFDFGKSSGLVVDEEDPYNVGDRALRVDWTVVKSTVSSATNKTTTTTTTVPVNMFVQDPPYFSLVPKGGISLAKFHNSHHLAAIAFPYGNGSVGLAGPHIEADLTWGIDGVDGPKSTQMAAYLISQTAKLAK